MYQNYGTAAQRLARTESFTKGVWCEAFTVENCNGKTCRHIWDNDIKVYIYIQGVPGRMCQTSGECYLKYTDITQNTYI